MLMTSYDKCEYVVGQDTKTSCRLFNVLDAKLCWSGLAQKYHQKCTEDYLFLGTKTQQVITDKENLNLSQILDSLSDTCDFNLLFRPFYF